MLDVMIATWTARIVRVSGNASYCGVLIGDLETT
jgi:Rap1a immunity proteins